jgi:hypothetical protein
MYIFFVFGTPTKNKPTSYHVKSSLLTMGTKWAKSKNLNNRCNANLRVLEGIDY